MKYHNTKLMTSVQQLILLNLVNIWQSGPASNSMFNFH